MAMNFPFAYWGSGSTATTWFLGGGVPPYSFNALAWSPALSIFVMGGNGAVIATSPDGVTWTLRTAASGTGAVSRLVWSAELGVFVYTSGGANFGRSADGITWAATTTPTVNGWAGLCWSPTEMFFVATSRDGINNRALTSADGVTWTTRTTVETGDMETVTYGNGRFVAPEYTGSSNVNVSLNGGVTWTNHASAALLAWREITYSAELGLFAVSSTGPSANCIQTSPNGTDWTRRSTPAVNVNSYGIIWVSAFNKFIVSTTASPGYKGLESGDGVVWTAESMVNGSWYDLAYSPALEIVGCAGDFAEVFCYAAAD